MRFTKIYQKRKKLENRNFFKKTLDKYPRLCYNNYSKRNEVMKMDKAKYIGKSKREIMAMATAEEKVIYFESRKGIPQWIEIFGKGYHYFLIFDKATRRVVA